MGLLNPVAPPYELLEWSQKQLYGSGAIEAGHLDVAELRKRVPG